MGQWGMSHAEWLGMLRDLLAPVSPLMPAPALGHVYSHCSCCIFAVGKAAPAFPNRHGAQNPLHLLPFVLLMEQ